MQAQQEYIQALIRLHIGLQRQGPGDTEFSNQLLSQINELPQNPRIADIGCGAGAGTLMLADRFKTRVRAVDFSPDFLQQLNKRAKQLGLEQWVETIECDMGKLDWEQGSIDLLWSEGAAYNLTFAGALKAWKPLMAAKGVAVISEMSYFSDQVPEAVRAYWQNAYPSMGTEAQNTGHANANGFKVSGIQRLPSSAWWDNYYGPLKQNMQAFRGLEDKTMQSVIAETDEEMKFFEQYNEYYGYSFYILKHLQEK